MRRGEAASLADQIKAWRAGAAEIEASQAARADNEEKAHVAVLAGRAADKALGAARRAAMRLDALHRDEEAHRLKEEEAARRAAEAAHEAKERHNMSVEEARQTCVDDFWGLPTKWDSWRRLEAYKRKVWQARIADRRKRMIQVGEVLADTAEETDEVRFGAGMKEPWMRDWVEGAM